MKCLHHLRSNEGETLVETIVAFLIITVILAGFAALVTTGMRLNAEGTRMDSNIESSWDEAGDSLYVRIESNGASDRYALNVTGDGQETSATTTSLPLTASQAEKVLSGMVNAKTAGKVIDSAEPQLYQTSEDGKYYEPSDSLKVAAAAQSGWSSLLEGMTWRACISEDGSEAYLFVYPNAQFAPATASESLSGPTSAKGVVAYYLKGNGFAPHVTAIALGSGVDVVEKSGSYITVPKAYASQASSILVDKAESLIGSGWTAAANTASYHWLALDAGTFSSVDWSASAAAGKRVI